MDQMPHILFLPSPGMGHFLPCLELAKKLVVHHHFSASFIIFTDDFGPKWSTQNPFMEAASLPNGLEYVPLPPPDFRALPDDMEHRLRELFSVSCSLQSIRNVFADLSANLNVVALVVDIFGTEAFDIAKEFEIPPYLLYPSSAMSLSLFLYIPKLDQCVSCEFSELCDPIRLPGCIAIPGKDFVEMPDRHSIQYQYILRIMKRYTTAEGIIVNTFYELEPGPLKGLQRSEKEFYDKNPMIYAVGPLVQSKSTSDDAEESLLTDWLDARPRASVLYICFGSHWRLSQAQINALALGLEMSETPFLWIVRFPKDRNDICIEDDPLVFLPTGFIERTKGRGLIVPNWASQQKILGHGAIGGFITHCGWNSVLESLVNGVPMIAWPLGAEQKMNALMVSEEVRVAFRVKANEEDGLVEGSEIANVVRNLMGKEGNKMRERVGEFKHVTKTVLHEEGSSWNSLADLASKWKKN